MGGGEILKKGFLIKSPPLEGGGGIKCWRKRWFCLRSSKVLEYYKHEHGDLKGVVNLEDCKAVNSDLFHKKYKFVFGVETKERVYYLVASTSEEMREWVEAICRVCRFTSHLPPEGFVQSGSTTLPPIRTSLPPPKGMAFTEKFHSSENGGSNDLYSLAQAAEHEVYQKLYQDPRVPSGIPLAEALASKGIGSGQRSSSSSSQSSSMASGGDTCSSRSSDYSSETGYFAPRSGDTTPSNYIGAAGLDPRALYATPQRKGGPGRLSPHPIPKPRAHTLAPTPPASLVLAPDAGPTHTTGLDQRSYTSTPGVGLTASGAEVMPNGYMRPRRTADRHPDYDYPPSGPPRPAGTPTSGSGSTSPRQHRSALLKPSSGSGTPYSSSSSSSSSSPSHTPPKDPHTYINMRALVDDLPPPIDRRSKPQQTTVPPRIDRALKPRSEMGHSPPQASSLKDAAVEPVVGSYSEDVFTESDIPLRTKRSLHYTQVDFDPVTRRPVPAPRGQGPRPPRRVNYTDVDLKATEQRAARAEGRGEGRQVSLGQAEIEALASKQYVNLDEHECVDDDTNPGYYTYMRNFTFEEADKPDYLQFFREQKPQGDQGEEDLYNDPRDT